MALKLGKHSGAAKLEPQRKRRKVLPSRLEIVACGPSLELLPDDILLCIMSLLDVKSLLRVSRVSKRFHHLHRHPSVWRDVDLSQSAIGGRLKLDNSRLLEKFISKLLHPSTWRVKLSSRWRHNPIVTTAVLDELFTKCPQIRSFTLYDCDLSLISHDCKLYHCESLEHISLYQCFKWMATVKPTWPKLTHLCLSPTSNISDSDLEYLASCQETATSLRVLDLSFDTKVTNDGVKLICKSMPNLHTLRLERCDGITVESMEDIAKLLHLQHLCFGPKKLSESAYIKLLKLFPRLKSLQVYLKWSVLQSVRSSDTTTLYQASGVDLQLYAHPLYAVYKS